MPVIRYAVSSEQTVAYFVREANNGAMSHIGVVPQSLQLQAQITLASLVWYYLAQECGSLTWLRWGLVRFVRLAPQVVIPNDGNFVGVIVLPL